MRSFVQGVQQSKCFYRAALIRFLYTRNLLWIDERARFWKAIWVCVNNVSLHGSSTSCYCWLTRKIVLPACVCTALTFFTAAPGLCTDWWDTLYFADVLWSMLMHVKEWGWKKQTGKREGGGGNNVLPLQISLAPVFLLPRPLALILFSLPVFPAPLIQPLYLHMLHSHQHERLNSDDRVFPSWAYAAPGNFQEITRL